MGDHLALIKRFIRKKLKHATVQRLVAAIWLKTRPRRTYKTHFTDSLPNQLCQKLAIVIARNRFFPSDASRICSEHF